MDSVHFALSDNLLIIIKRLSSSLLADSIDNALAVFVHADCGCLGRMLFKGPCCQYLLPEPGETGLTFHCNYRCWCRPCLQDILTQVIWRSKIGLSDPLGFCLLVTPSLKWFIAQEGTSSYGEASSLLWLLKDYKGSLLLAEKDVTAKDWCWSRVCQRVSSPWMTNCL